MERAITVCCAILLVSCVAGLKPTDNRNEEKDLTKTGEYNKKERNLRGFWMGPRIGRRKRNPKSEDVFSRSPVLDNEELAELVDAIEDSPWAIVAVKEGKRDFTPRLGRESGEEMAKTANQNYGNEQWIQDPELTGDYMAQRSPPFAPRLGRQMYAPWIPRLGRKI